MRCQLIVQIHADWTFPAIGSTADVDKGLDGLELLVKDANAIAQWMTTKDKQAHT